MRRSINTSGRGLSGVPRDMCGGVTRGCVLQELYLRYVETASKLNTVTAQLADSQAQRAAAEAAAQEAKLERSRALRAAEDASLATAAAVDDTEVLRHELEEERRAAAAREALVAGLEADLKGRDAEIARLQSFVHRAELLQMECDGLKLKVRSAECLSVCVCVCVCESPRRRCQRPCRHVCAIKHTYVLLGLVSPSLEFLLTALTQLKYLSF